MNHFVVSARNREWREIFELLNIAAFFCLFAANQYKITLESSPPLGVPISTYGGVEAIVINGNDDFNETHLITQ